MQFENGTIGVLRVLASKLLVFVAKPPPKTLRDGCTQARKIPTGIDQVLPMIMEIMEGSDHGDQRPMIFLLHNRKLVSISIQPFNRMLNKS